MILSEGRRFINLSRPLYLVFAALTYTLGASIARYLSMDFHWPTFWLGLLALLALQFAVAYLFEYFHLPLTSRLPGETTNQRIHFRGLLLQLSFIALGLFGMAFLTLLLSHLINLASGILLTLDLLLVIAYAVPPMRLSERGYGEIIMACRLAALLPAISFSLQMDEFHRLLPLTTFPLTLLALAYFLASNFPTFAADLRTGFRTLLTRLTWQHAIPVHHILIIAAFLLFGFAPLAGIPWRLIWPVFLTLPFAIVQVFWLQRISRGGRTLWKFFIPLAAVVFGMPVYLLALTFWIR